MNHPILIFLFRCTRIALIAAGVLTLGFTALLIVIFCAMVLANTPLTWYAVLTSLGFLVAAALGCFLVAKAVNVFVLSPRPSQQHHTVPMF